jgi:hypothetical protein
MFLLGVLGGSFLLDHSENQEVVERVLVKRQVDLLMRLFSIDFHDMSHLQGKSCHDSVLVFLNQLLGL